VQRESNITLFLNASACEPVMADEGAIQAIVAEQLSTEKTLHLEADIFIDCSGDGRIAADAGAEFRMGREARDEFGEDRAPAVADHCTLGSSLMFKSRDMGRPMPFVAPDWAKRYPTDADLPHRSHGRIESGFWWIELGGTMDTIDDNEKIRDELLKHLIGVWDHIKNGGAHGAENHIIEWVGAVPAKRESRRFIGDHILTQGDVESARLFEDRVAYGGWPIDLHPPEGIRSLAPPAHMPPLEQPYSIPFRALYSRNIGNLMMAGRNISVSHAALATTRVMGTCATLGQAVGTAAALCKKHGVLPREVGRAHIAELQQQLLKDDAYVIGLSNDDPNDLARTATASASSERTLEVAEADTTVALDCTRGQIFMLTANRLDAVEGNRAGSLGELEVSRLKAHGDGVNVLLGMDVQRDAPAGGRREVYRGLTFDTNLDVIVPEGPVPECVRDYVVSASVDGDWVELQREIGNHHRRRRHTFAPVEADGLRIEVLATNGSPEARIYEVRAYRERA